jgi:hypothetical protein
VKSDSLNTRPEGPLTDLERREFYLREGERLAHMGSWSLRPDGTFDYWSPETFVLFGFDPSCRGATRRAGFNFGVEDSLSKDQQIPV